MKPKTIQTITTIIDIGFVFLILASLARIYYDYKTHPEDYIIERNETVDYYNLTKIDCDQVGCSCPEQKALQKIVYWVGELKWIGGLFVGMVLVKYIINNEKLLKALEGDK